MAQAGEAAPPLPRAEPFFIDLPELKTAGLK